MPGERRAHTRIALASVSDKSEGGLRMFKRGVLASLFLFFLAACGASAQVCPLNGHLSDKMVCSIPQVYGPFALSRTADPTQSVLLTAFGHEALFFNDSAATYTYTIAPLDALLL